MIHHSSVSAAAMNYHALSPLRPRFCPRTQFHHAVHSRYFGGLNCLLTRRRVVSRQSNHRILNPKRRSKFGRPLSTYDADGEDDVDEDDDWFSDEESLSFEISEADKERLNMKSLGSKRQGSITRRGRSLDLEVSSLAHELEKKQSKHGLLNGRAARKEVSESSSKNKFYSLLEEIGLDERYVALLDYLSTFGLDESHFIQMYERHMPSLQINVDSAKERLDYLLSVGVKHRDVRKIILRQPQILEYSVENNLKSHVRFLVGLGIPETRIGNIITATPSLFSYSVEGSLMPSVKYLQDEIGIQESDIGKVVQLSPQILVQRIDTAWNARLSFLTNELASPRQNIVKMVTKHPQILHYSIEDGLRPRINFLRSIGMQNQDILKVLTSITQVFSLSLERNLKPKYIYLINELGNEVQSLTKYPTYLSLSLDQRIRPRHQFLVSLKRSPKGPFPLSFFFPKDECFCKQWAGTSIDQYLDFKQSLLLKDFAKKYERV